jgi:hypothetical protein
VLTEEKLDDIRDQLGHSPCEPASDTRYGIIKRDDENLYKITETVTSLRHSVSLVAGT